MKNKLQLLAKTSLLAFGILPFSPANDLCAQTEKNMNEKNPPSQNQPMEKNWILDNGLVRFAIDRERGLLAEGWNLQTSEKYMVRSADEYSVDRGGGNKPEISTEENDIVESVIDEKTGGTGDARIISLKCKNPAWNIEIVKTYELNKNDRKLIKKVRFSNKNAEGLLGLFSHASALNFSPDYAREGYVHSRNERDSGHPFQVRLAGSPPRRPIGVSRGQAQICMVHPQKNNGVGHYKYLVNNRFDLKTAMGRSYLTPQGWIIPIASDFLDAGKTLSTETHYTMFKGGHVQFHMEYMDLPAYREAHNYQVAPWLKDVRFVSGWKEIHDLGEGVPVESYLKLFDKDEPIFGFAITPWTDPMWQHRGDYLDGEIELYPDAVQEIATLKRVQAACPRLKISNYTWHYSIGPKSKIFLNHPEWLSYAKDGSPQKLFDLPKVDLNEKATFRPLISNPDYLRYVSDRIKRVMRELKYEIYYTDDLSFSRNYADWKTRTAIHNYHWIDFWTAVREAIKSCGEDKVYFANSYAPDLIGAECGFIERSSKNPWLKPDELAAGSKSWKALADRMFLTKLYQHDECRWIAPIFWGHHSLKGARNNDPWYSNYVIGLGLKPSHPGEADAVGMGGFWNSLLSKMPYINAAYEMRGAKVVEADVSPCWWKDDQSQIEACTLRQGGAAFIPVISHEKDAGKTKVSADTAGLGLDPSAETYFWVFDMTDPRQFKKDDVLKPDWLKTSIMTKRLIKKSERLEKRIEIEIETRPNLLSLVMITQIPAAICSVNGKPSQILLPHTLDIAVEGKLDGTAKTSTLRINSRKDAAEIMAYFPAAWGEPKILADGKPAASEKVSGFNLPFHKFQVGKGETRITLTCK
ncbi:MAG: hypothetical protein PHV34_15875 [Verrucomicrobiae bacterium]|nr:hypothetical protein [Verrucomicrobiae bacterium]